MDHSCPLTALPSPLSVFGYGAHRLILRAHPHEKIIGPMPNFYESAALYKEPRARQKYCLRVIAAELCFFGRTVRL
jgi:hypothetical protein